MFYRRNFKQRNSNQNWSSTTGEKTEFKRKLKVSNAKKERPSEAVKEIPKENSFILRNREDYGTQKTMMEESISSLTTEETATFNTNSTNITILCTQIKPTK